MQKEIFTNEQDKSAYYTRLRKQAEEIQDKDLAGVKNMPTEDIHKVLHELQVYQIELELQNEELQKAQQELEESRSRYLDLYDNAPVGYVTFDKDGLIVEINLTGASMLGVGRINLIKRGFSNFIARDFHNEFYYHRRQAIETRRPQTCRIKLLKKDNTQFYAQIESIALFDKEGNFSQLRTTITDITVQKQIETQLRQAQKMEAVGTLAGGIAHDFNNMLGVILGNTELAMEDVPEWNPARLNLEETRKACLKSRGIVQQLLSFSRKADPNRKPVEISPIINDCLKFLRSSIPTSIDIQKTIPDESGIVSADSTQIHQVMMNLCTNAAQAMTENRGILEVRLSVIEIGEHEAIQDTELQKGRYVRITVSDTGQGIAKEHMDRIFEPYFTTKDADKGSGIGLSVVYGIVKSHNGAISVESEYGKGTTFSILLPFVEKAPASEKEIDTIVPTGSESILFIDDEEAMANMACQMLERLGYSVTVKTCSHSALETFQNQPEDFDLIITDMTMPNITGDMLAEEFQKIRPGIPIILCTGFSERINDEKAKSIGVRALAMKPITKNELAKTIRYVLGERK